MITIQVQHLKAFEEHTETNLKQTYLFGCFLNLGLLSRITEKLDQVSIELIFINTLYFCQISLALKDHGWSTWLKK